MSLRLPVLLLLGAGLCLGCSRSVDDAAKPHADLTPRAVVETVLRALQSNDEPTPDSGIATAFAFASPGNRAQTGPLPRFAAMVKTGYAPLLDHRRAEVGPPVATDGRLVFPVRVYPKEGAVRLYLFVLAESDSADCPGCWMTDGVVDRTDQAPAEVTA